MREGGVDKVDEKGWWEQSDTGVIRVISGEEVRPAGEGVGASEKFSGNVYHFEVKVGEVDEPARLSAIKRLGLSKVGEVFMVCEALHGKGGAVEIMAPGF